MKDTTKFWIGLLISSKRMKKLLFILTFLTTIGYSQSPDTFYNRTFMEDFDTYANAMLNPIEDTITFIYLIGEDTSFLLLKTPALHLKSNMDYQEFSLRFYRPRKVSVDGFFEWYISPVNTMNKNN